MKAVFLLLVGIMALTACDHNNNPFVYQNLLPAQNFTNNGYVMGDWMGSNADRLTGEIKYTPIPRLRFTLRHEMLRKGGNNSVEQQYFAQPQPKFLNNLQFLPIWLLKYLKLLHKLYLIDCLIKNR